MEWKNKPLQWDNEGTEPSEDLKANGFVGGYKPPAPVFNAFLHRTQKCIEELQEVVGAEDESTTLLFQNKNVATTAWVNDTTYQESGFLFKADIACEGVTADFLPTVIFSVADAMSGNFAPACDSGAGVVTIYAMTKPTSAIIIPVIECTKVVG